LGKQNEEKQGEQDDKGVTEPIKCVADEEVIFLLILLNLSFTPLDILNADP
jgi:hypothetical protein